MTYALAQKMTGWFIRQGLLQQEDYEVYVYCIDSLLHRVLFYTLLLLFAVWLNMVPATLCYYLGFLPFRYTAGGYHAKSDFGCFLLTWLIYGGSMALVRWTQTIPFSLTGVLALFLVVTATVVAWLLAPIDHFHKPVSTAQKQRMRKVCLLFQAVFLLLTMLLLWRHADILAFSLALGNGLAALFLLPAYYQKGDF